MALKLLDICSGAGLAAIGYHQAGWEVTGVDIQAQPRYPFQHIQADALEVLEDLDFCRSFDAIHASPPCQLYSAATARIRADGGIYPDLLPPVRTALLKVGIPSIIENVPRAPIRPDIVLHGWMFNLNVMRKRLFELNGWWGMQPGITKRKGNVLSGDFISVFGNGGYVTGSRYPKGWRPKFDQGNSLDTWHFAMGIPPEYRFTYSEIAEGIPPAYTKYLGELLAEYVQRTQTTLLTTI